MKKIKFTQKGHIYTLIQDDGTKKQLISVTALLAKHGLAPDYSQVDEKTLQQKAERGEIVHDEIEHYIKTGEEGFTSENLQFINICKEQNITALKSEFVVYNDDVAGRVDLTGLIDGAPFIGEIKTTAQLYRQTIAWQLSLYAYLSGNHYDKFLCLHFLNENICKVIEITPIPIEEIERLLDCESNGELYTPKTLIIDDQTCTQVIALHHALQRLKEEEKKIEQEKNAIQQVFIAKMEENNIKCIDNKYLKITYISPTVRETLDSEKLRKEQPDIIKQYIKKTNIKACVKITLKENEL